MSRLRLVLFVFVASLAVGLTLASAACGAGTPSPGGSGSTTTATSPSNSTTTSSPGSGTSTSGPATSSTSLPAGAISHPTGADEVVLRVSTAGGLLAPLVAYTAVPEFTLYGDGRIVATGPTTQQYPQAALPNLQTAVVSEQDIQAILAAAKEAGLFQNGVDYGQPGVADVGTTTITVNADGMAYTSQIYALGFEDASGLTAQQQQARAAVGDFTGKLGDPSAITGNQAAWEPYDFSALAVYSRPVDTTASTDQGGVQPNHLPWPLADLAAAGESLPAPGGLRKLVVTGDDLNLLKPLLDKATQITLWKSGDTEYNLSFRPLLPDEPAAL